MQNKIEIKLLIDCQYYIPELSKIWYQEMSQHWVPNSSVERAHQNLMKHLNHDNCKV